MRWNNVLLAFAAGAALVAAQNTDQTTAAATTKATSAATTAAPTTDKLTGVSSFVKSSSTSSDDADSSTTSSKASSSAASKTSGAASNTGITDLPTLAGATVPDMVIPFTADAPFMQKSTVPEGTIFIAVGACLAFLGACILAWRAMVAYSINRSVKRAAMASVMASDAKTKYGPGGNLYAMPQGSSLSLDALTSAGKPLSSGGAKKENRKSAQQKADPSSLFFSPTAGQRNSAYMPVSQNRSSTYLPAGYYATPSAQAAGGRDSMVMGGAPSLQPTHNRHSRAEYSPPSSRDDSHPRSALNPQQHSRTGSNALLSPTHQLYAQPSTSSLAVGIGAQPDDGSNVSSTLPGQRAPSAYFDDVLQEHGSGPRERY
ncbi:hypothetical protein E4T39_08437 [Aureobasidium subglaciale]|nr:hypothetical protein E4T39_08437 [Aureobasidium subglaciale]